MTSFIVALFTTISVMFFAPTETRAQIIPVSQNTNTASILNTPSVPFYSQFTDITSPTWKKVGCGIASLAMVIDFYKPAVSVNTLLKQGIAAGAYNDTAGWSYNGLISVSKGYGLQGKTFDLGKSTSKEALSQFKKQLIDGPVIASVHYKFDPKSTIPHLVVINRIIGEEIYYNDPAAKTGDKHIPLDTFVKAWKKRFIVIRPA